MVLTRFAIVLPFLSKVLMFFQYPLKHLFQCLNFLDYEYALLYIKINQEM